MTKWEYKYEYFNYLEAPAMIKINKLGKDGWELVGFTYDKDTYELIFKRPIK